MVFLGLQLSVTHSLNCTRTIPGLNDAVCGGSTDRDQGVFEVAHSGLAVVAACLHLKR
jgi:hypothetical protein